VAAVGPGSSAMAHSFGKNWFLNMRIGFQPIIDVSVLATI